MPRDSQNSHPTARSSTSEFTYHYHFCTCAPQACYLSSSRFPGMKPCRPSTDNCTQIQAGKSTLACTRPVFASGTQTLAPVDRTPYSYPADYQVFTPCLLPIPQFHHEKCLVACLTATPSRGICPVPIRDWRAPCCFSAQHESICLPRHHIRSLSSFSHR